MPTDEFGEPLECLNGPEDCVGPVDYRLAPGGKAWPRCEYHANKRWDDYDDENSVERYADSDAVPEWFDPSYAGESWDD